jgi:excisionase family DNA binding protein
MAKISKNKDLLDSMTTNDVSKELGVAVRSVQLWLDNGILEGWKTPGGHRRIYRSSFDRLVERIYKPNISKNEDPLKVFIVEDDNTMLMLYRMTIASWELPVETTCFNNGWAGLVGISQSKPDLLIIDLRMPEMNGFSMLKALIKSDEFKHMSILVVTGLDSNEIKEKGGLPEGVQLFGKNPIPFQQIKDYILSLLEKKISP